MMQLVFRAKEDRMGAKLHQAKIQSPFDSTDDAAIKAVGINITAD
jgi:hypothetical protein